MRSKMKEKELMTRSVCFKSCEHALSHGYAREV